MRSVWLALAALTAAGLRCAADAPPAPSAAGLPVANAAPGADAPLRAAYTATGELNFPQHYREWIFLSAGLDMSYREDAPAGHSVFDNVFAEPRAYREFVRTGTWPDGTLLVLESRGATERGSINRRGKFQNGDLIGIEVHAKDTRRFAGGWAFFAFQGRAAATPIARSAACYACHLQHGAVDTTFVQFYPTLLEIARAKGTLLPER